ncbi:MAG: YqhA family protein [Methanomicrobiales archaeon]|nr:YqhA family protein [Methanomicrobiales archaeon]
MKNDDVNSSDRNGSSQHNCQEKGGVHSFIQSMAVGSKWLFGLAIIGTGIISADLFIYGFLLSLSGVYKAIIQFNFAMETVQVFLATSIEIIDIFLVATVFYLISMGLYELFVAKAPLPGWVEIRNLDDLKTKLLGLIVIALAVLFLGVALTHIKEMGIPGFGTAVAIMIIAISSYLWVKHE